MPAYVGNPLAGDPIFEASSASELRIAITTKQVSRAGHPSDLLVARTRPAAPGCPAPLPGALGWVMTSSRIHRRNGPSDQAPFGHHAVTFASLFLTADC